MVSFTPRPLYPQGKSPWYPLDRRLGGPQSRSGRGGEEKNSQPPPGIETYNSDRPVRSLVAIPTKLSKNKRIATCVCPENHKGSDHMWDTDMGGEQWILKEKRCDALNWIQLAFDRVMKIRVT
jgi:hypothetical protein